MNIDERLGITWKDNIPFREKYGKVVALIGLENLKSLMPEDVETLAKKYEKDNTFFISQNNNSYHCSFLFIIFCL